MPGMLGVVVLYPAPVSYSLLSFSQNNALEASSVDCSLEAEHVLCSFITVSPLHVFTRHLQVVNSRKLIGGGLG